MKAISNYTAMRIAKLLHFYASQPAMPLESTRTANNRRLCRVYIGMLDRAKDINKDMKSWKDG